MTTSVDRFQLLEVSQLLFPHKCSVCGGFSNRKFVDFGLDVEYHGKVYICEHCFVGAAKVVDCVPVEKYNQILQQNEELQAVIQQLIIENKGLRDAVDGFRIISSPHSNSNNILSSPLDENKSKQGHTNSSIDGGKEGFTKQAPEWRSQDLRNNDSAADPLEDLGLGI